MLVSTEDGRVLQAESSPNLVSPTALVVPVTDALKDVSPAGVVAGSIDRDATWRVAAVYLDAHAVSQLDGHQMDALELHQAIVDADLRWGAHPFDEALAGRREP